MMKSLMIKLIKSIFNKQFFKSALSGFLVYLFSLIVGNIMQFFVLLSVKESIRTDLTVIIAFSSSVFLNFLIHNRYVFIKTFHFGRLIKFYIANSSDLIIHVTFWNIYESFFGSPDILNFNLLSFSLVVLIYPVKFAFYKYIYKN